MKVEGYVSKAVVKRWLENYSSLVSGDVMQDAPAGNSGPKTYDGIRGGQLNKIMLEQAIKSLSPLHRSCIEAKYVEQLPKHITIKALEISEGIYKKRINDGIDQIYRYLNGEKADIVQIPDNHRKLLSKILG